ncbi:helix-turn-helix transcriptional regulator [Longispora fulva]|nr:helix-turn-helix transcriptional regulator [Longispora fulva]
MSSNCITTGILTQARASWRSGDLGAGISYAKAAALANCDRCQEPCALYARLQQALFFALIRRIDEARQILDEVTANPAIRDDPKFTAITTLVEAKITLVNGDLVDAAAQSEIGLQLANEVGLTAWTPLGNLILATTALRRGELSTSIYYANRLKEDAVFGREMLSAGQSAWIVIQVTEAEKGREHAAMLARELLESEATTRSLLTDEPSAIPWLVRLMISHRRPDLARYGVRLSERLAAENPDVPEIAAAALHGAGLLEEDIDMLRRAADMHTDPWGRALAVEDIGMLLAEGREGCPEAVENLELAMRSYAEMGSLRDSSRVRSGLRCINANPQSQARFWPSSGIPGLTDTEYAVAKLVSNGLTNGQAANQMFLSRHTVAFHLRKIFQKIGVKSRLELAVMWNELAADAGNVRARSGVGESGAPSTRDDDLSKLIPRQLRAG